MKYSTFYHIPREVNRLAARDSFIFKLQETERNSLEPRTGYLERLDTVSKCLMNLVEALRELHDYESKLP